MGEQDRETMYKKYVDLWQGEWSWGTFFATKDAAKDEIWAKIKGSQVKIKLANCFYHVLLFSVSVSVKFLHFLLFKAVFFVAGFPFSVGLLRTYCFWVILEAFLLLKLLFFSGPAATRRKIKSRHAALPRSLMHPSGLTLPPWYRSFFSNIYPIRA